jgi:hypothetical protein
MKQIVAWLIAIASINAFVPAVAAEGHRVLPLDANADGTKARKTKQKLSDQQIKQILIDESIAAYSGNCPCPYSRARNKSLCGRRSAYNREGGAAPLCFPKDVTAQMVREYRDSQPEE